MPNLHWFFATFPENFQVGQDEQMMFNDPELWHHLKNVMRFRANEGLVLVDQDQGIPYECQLIDLANRQVLVKVLNAIMVAPKLFEITAAVGLIKGPKWDWLLQKLTELGISRIIPLITEQTVIDVKKPETKIERWHQILKQAAEQSEQTSIPQIECPIKLSEFLSQKERFKRSLNLVATERSGKALSENLMTQAACYQVIFAIGPEGGWTVSELNQFQSANFHWTSLGDKIFRSETAAVYLTSVIHYVCSQQTTPTQ